ncbi:clusterin-like protein 1 [Polypterus senegalus]|uniref:clusterin-like protein 1 n=1 Tax=Polypterus senegalus TaxID=55291 RepID=UPI0019667D37|nr:clusterin-like protein 1 [Polypterus senegalus]
MKLLFTIIVYLTWLGASWFIHAQNEDNFVQETLKQLSTSGEKYVNEELQRALSGVKHMKKVIDQNAEKHEHLIMSLKHSSEKKQRALQLANDVQQKLQEAEDQCKEALQNSWDDCKPCLKDTCQTFYTSNCRRGFFSFSAKVENFFQEFSPFLSTFDNQDILVNQNEERGNNELAHMEDSFKEMVSEVSTLFDRSVSLFYKLHEEFDQSFQAAFISGLNVEGAQKKQIPLNDVDSAQGFLEGLTLNNVMESFFDFGKAIFEEFSSVVTEVLDEFHDTVTEEEEHEGDPERANLSSRIMIRPNKNLCRALRRNISECWHLQSKCYLCQEPLSQECSSVPELRSKLSEISQLMNISIQQYEEVLQIVQHHAENTGSWFKHMADSFGWVAELVNASVDSDNMFSITTVLPRGDETDPMSTSDTTVKVNLLSSPTFTFTVPDGLKVQDPAFVKYVAGEALERYKMLFKHDVP